MSNSAFSRAHERVTPKGKRSWSGYLLAGYLIVLVGVMIWIVDKQRSYQMLGFQLEEIRTENQVLQEESKRLQIEIGKLKSPDRIIEASMKQGLRTLPEERRFEVRFRPESQQPRDNELILALNE